MGLVPPLIISPTFNPSPQAEQGLRCSGEVTEILLLKKWQEFARLTLALTLFFLKYHQLYVLNISPDKYVLNKDGWKKHSRYGTLWTMVGKSWRKAGILCGLEEKEHTACL